MPLSREPYRRELRRFDLALRMVRLQARTHTVCAWTGLSRPRVLSVLRSLHTQPGGRPARRHGPPPSALRPFWESRRLRREAAALAGLCVLFGVLDPGERHCTPGVGRGERLCLAYETYLTFVPRPRLTLEHAALLVAALAEGTEIALEPCPGCLCTLLVDRLDRPPRCSYCAG